MTNHVTIHAHSHRSPPTTQKYFYAHLQARKLPKKPQRSIFSAERLSVANIAGIRNHACASALDFLLGLLCYLPTLNQPKLVADPVNEVPRVRDHNHPAFEAAQALGKGVQGLHVDVI